jgi:Pyruvate/2-oxoacid:ferredoxin oxidoreductase delta subunit
MKRTVIKIDEKKCTGCGLCVTGCHEGALQLIEGKARMISDLFCDGLGACIGECPEGAIELIEREAEPYNEQAVMERISPKGEKTVLAHLKHLKDHNEMKFFNEGLGYIKENNLNIDISTLISKKENNMNNEHLNHGGGCPGSRTLDFKSGTENTKENITDNDIPSQLRQWPVQLHLLNPMASYFQNADLLLAADCVAFSLGNFHNSMLKGKSLAIACPKLDSNKESYIEKLTSMIDNSKINTISVAIMEVPCCSGLLQIAKAATQKAIRKIPVKQIIVGIQGNILKEDWV